jgi:DNA repair protein RadC
MYQRAELPVQLAGVEATRAFFAPCFTDAAAETLWVAHLDGQSHCIHLARYPGDADSAPVPTREILTDAVRLGTAGLILAHNHPSGSTEPSRLDRKITHRLAQAAEAMNVAIVDHLIFAGEQCTSMRRLGLL